MKLLERDWRVRVKGVPLAREVPRLKFGAFGQEEMQGGQQGGKQVQAVTRAARGCISDRKKIGFREVFMRSQATGSLYMFATASRIFFV